MSARSLALLLGLTFLTACAVSACTSDSPEARPQVDAAGVSVAACEGGVLDATLSTFGGSNTLAESLQLEYGIDSIQFRAYRAATANTDAIRTYYDRGVAAAAEQVIGSIRVACSLVTPLAVSLPASDNGCVEVVRNVLRQEWLGAQGGTEALTTLQQRFGIESAEYRTYLLLVGDQRIGQIRLTKGVEAGLEAANRKIQASCLSP